MEELTLKASRLVFLSSHKDLEPYIQRVADGASPTFSGKPITTISLSSGTTQGKPKFVPFNDELMENYFADIPYFFCFRNREFPIENGKALQFIYSSNQTKTKGLVSSTFSHSIVLAFRTFEQVWEELCADIREGVLSSRVTCPSVRSAMAKLLKPNPELADLVEKKCSGLRVDCGNINPTLPPESATYAVLPNIGYFEFIPLKENIEEHMQDKVNGSFLSAEPKPVGLTEVKVGEEYEVIITNFAEHEKDLQLAVEEAAKLIAEESWKWLISLVMWMYRPTPFPQGHTIGPLELRFVRKGTFEKILGHYLGLGAALSQFKTPRCVGPMNSKVLQILCDNAKNYFIVGLGSRGRVSKERSFVGGWLIGLVARLAVAGGLVASHGGEPRESFSPRVGSAAEGMRGRGNDFRVS
ncbi:hypothetical protein F3Y22_tig00110622pilonHSYRG00083 [Hibiscus syriacus]|uniref:Indole-3-acetic acid-amido synthetase GH3.5 n=1 Tax=Hibiscus syriacus TaxID=106335 RepID=A0A6A2ZZ16_HIBSY|nr:hypothetical protein F3Y22_tig00110622pilonHSYRG00083 [Hibiscus syriacus]